MFGRAKRRTCGAVIVAAGSGTRMQLAPRRDGTSVNKVFLELDGVPILGHTLLAFESCRSVDGIVLVTRACDIPLCKPLADELGITKLKSIISGGATRQESVRAGLAALGEEYDLAAIHDAARCLIRPEDIEAVVAEADAFGAATLGAPCSDSLKRVDASGTIVEEVDRTDVYRVQTPQVFVREQIIAAHEKAWEAGVTATDDCGVAQRAGIRVRMVDAGAYNIKITTQEDLALAEAFLAGGGC